MNLGWGFLLIFSVFLNDKAFASCDDSLLSRYDHLSVFTSKDEVKNPYDLDQIKQVRVDQIENLREIKAEDINGSGFKFERLMLGELDGKKVFIKICNLRLDGRSKRLSEASFTKLMSDLGIGPYFHGVVVIDGARAGIITDFIEGYSIKHHVLYTKNSNIATSITNFLQSIGINSVDLQYRVDLTGRYWIVDTGLYNVIKEQPLLEKDRFSAQLLTLLQKLDVQ